MMTMRRKIAVLGTLYLAQGLPYGFFTQALPVLLRKDGRSLGEIGLASLLSIPWALKFVWAPLVDRYATKKVWIAAVQLVTASLLAALAFFSNGSLDVLLVAILVINACNATQDIATDGLAVAMLSAHERGVANGVQVAGYRLGMIIGGGALLIVFDRTGWSATFGTMALLSLFTTAAVLFAKEPQIARVTAMRVPGSFFLRRGGWRILLLVLIYKAGENFASGMLRPYLTDLGLSLSELGEMLGTVGFLAGLIGALTGGAFVGRLGRRQALLVFGVLQAFAVACYAWLAHQAIPSNTELYAICALEHFASGTATASLFTAMMDWSRPATAASDYTTLASAVVIATGGAQALSGFSAQHLGYFSHFTLATGLALVAVAAAAVLYPRPGDLDE
jgi:MFS transporter, PAT family, beta-lactamase induction signal transducer AmpG